VAQGETFRSPRTASKLLKIVVEKLQTSHPFLISNFRRILNVLCFLLGDSPASEFYMPTFRNTLFHLHRQVGACRMNSAGDMFGVL
jgi:hypothetical protein